MKITKQKQIDVSAEIRELESLPTADLAKRWQSIFGCERPKRMKRRFLQRALAHRAQSNVFGGLRRRARKALAAAVTDETDDTGTVSAKTLAPGTRLVRQWNGSTYSVCVLENGYAFNGTTFASLSAIAREITGARWSGPRFFGL